jgi:hypothetical protein
MLKANELSFHPHSIKINCGVFMMKCFECQMSKVKMSRGESPFVELSSSLSCCLRKLLRNGVEKSERKGKGLSC